MLGYNMTTPQRRSRSENQYTCKACHKVFVREGAFLQHKCKQMQREEEVRSPDGQAAWTYYTMWLRAQRRMPPSASTFTSSKYFRTFMEFVKFVRSVNLPAPDKFIWLMVQKQFSPTMWRQDEVYSIYMEYLDKQLSPIEQASMSVKVLLKRAGLKDVDVSEVLSTYTANDLIHAVRTRQLTPWILLFSKKFKAIMTAMTTEQRLIMENLIRPEYWMEQFNEHSETVPKIKEIISELGI